MSRVRAPMKAAVVSIHFVFSDPKSQRGALKFKSLKLVFLKSLYTKFQLSMCYGFKMKNLETRRLYFSKFRKKPKST